MIRIGDSTRSDGQNRRFQKIRWSESEIPEDQMVRIKKARYAIINFSNKEISKIITEFGKLPYKSYDRRRPKHEPTDSYFYLSRYLVKCMMRADSLNSHVYHVRMEMASTKQIPILHVFSTYKSELKEFLFNETILRICSTDESKSKGIIFNECSTEEDES